jgi:Transposase DDE domain
MPYKFNEARRHKIPKAQYRVTNWPEYDPALVRRGSLTVWVTEEAIATWHAPATGKPDGQPVYSDLAIETGLALRLVLSPGLRQVEGALGSIMQLLGVELRIPDHATFSRRGGGLHLLSKPIGRDGPLQLLIDSTGLKIDGEGEWLEARVQPTDM